MPTIRLDAIAFFEKKCEPLSAKSCWQCHGDIKPKAQLRLTSRAAVLSRRRQRAAVVPGKPVESRLLKAVRYLSEQKMPPDGKLSDRQIAALRPLDRYPGHAVATRSQAILGQDASTGNLWQTLPGAYQPVQVAPLTPVRDHD